MVVLEPAGSVLVIRQTSLSGGGGVPGNVNSNPVATNDTHALINHTAVSNPIASNDHNQNRIVVVRSSTSSSTCMTNTVRTTPCDRDPCAG